MGEQSMADLVDVIEGALKKALPNLREAADAALKLSALVESAGAEDFGSLARSMADMCDTLLRMAELLGGGNG